MKKFKIIAVFAAMLAGVSIVYAGFYDSLTVTNHISVGDVNIGLKEFEMYGKKEVSYANQKMVMPGDKISKIPRIYNYAKSCWVRAKITFSSDREDMEGLDDGDLSGFSEDWLKLGDYYYYTRVLEHGKYVDLFREVTIPEEWNESHSLQNLAIDVHVDAIQAANFSPDFHAMSPWGDQNIELCVHEENGKVTCTRENIKLSVVFHGDVYRLMSVPDDFFANFGSTMPGDILTDSITVSNTTDREAEILFCTGLEEQSPEQLDLLEKIQLYIRMNGQDLYKGDLKAENMKEQVSLGLFQPGQSGKLDFALYVPKELDNAYALRDANVQWIFSVRGEEEATEGGETLRTTAAVEELREPVKTGDDTKIMPYILLLLGTAAVLIVVFIRKGGRKHEA